MGTVTVALVAVVLVYTGGLEAAMMKLLGVGASGVYEVALTSTSDFLGTNGNKSWIIGSADMNGTSVFGQFSAVPADMDTSDKGLGLIVPIFSSPSDPLSEQYQKHEYATPIVSLQAEAPYLSAVQVADYNTTDTSIDYFMRSAGSPEGVTAKEFLPLDLTEETAAKDGNGIKIRAAIVEQTVSQYVQVKLVMNNNTATNRSAVYSINFQYKESAEVVDVSKLSDKGDAIERNISIQYELTGAPTSAEINILSANLANSVVYSAKGIDFTQIPSPYAFKATLAPGVYALTISAPVMQTKIIPFAVDNKAEIRLNAGSFSGAGVELKEDLNGDGVVNVGDYIILQRRNASDNQS